MYSILLDTLFFSSLIGLRLSSQLFATHLRLLKCMRFDEALKKVGFKHVAHVHVDFVKHGPVTQRARNPKEHKEPSPSRSKACRGGAGQANSLQITTTCAWCKFEGNCCSNRALLHEVSVWLYVVAVDAPVFSCLLEKELPDRTRTICTIFGWIMLGATASNHCRAGRDPHCVSSTRTATIAIFCVPYVFSFYYSSNCCCCL